MYNFSNITALIIDDMSDARSFLRNNLSNLGFKSAPQVSTIKEALEKLSTIKPNVIICDYYLGDGIDGQQFLEYVRNNNLIDPSVAFVMVTAESGYQKVAAAAEFTPDVYMLKPFTSDALEQRLVVAIERRKVLAPITKMMNSGMPVVALKMIEDKLKESPTFKSQLMKMHGECLEAVDVDQAIDFYNLLAKNNIPYALTGLARCHIVKNEMDEAKAILDSIVNSGSLYVAAYDLYASIATPEESLKIHQQAADLIPSSNRYRKVAKSAVSSGNFELAEKIYDDVIKKSRHGFNITVEDQIGRIKAIAGTGRVAEAQASLETLKVSLQANGVNGLSAKDELEIDSAVATLSMKNGDQDSAREALLRAMRAEKMTVDQALELAQMGQEMGLIQESIDLMSRFLANNDNNTNARAAVVSSQFGGDNYDTLLEHKDKTLNSINTEAASLMAKGEPEQAFSILDRYADQYHSNTSILYNAAKAGLEVIKLGTLGPAQSHRAFNHLKNAIKLDPKNPLARDLVSQYKVHGFSV